jgi:hypothetical protein
LEGSQGDRKEVVRKKDKKSSKKSSKKGRIKVRQKGSNDSIAEYCMMAEARKKFKKKFEKMFEKKFAKKVRKYYKLSEGRGGVGS